MKRRQHVSRDQEIVAEITHLQKVNKRLLEAVHLALDLYEQGLVDFAKYGLTCDRDILVKYYRAINLAEKERA